MTRSALLQLRISGALLKSRPAPCNTRKTNHGTLRRRFPSPLRRPQHSSVPLSAGASAATRSAPSPTAPHRAARRQRQRQEWRSRTSGSPARPEPTPAASSAPRGARAAAGRAALGSARLPAPPRPSRTFPPEEGHGAGEGARRPPGGGKEGAGERGQRAGLPMNEAPSPARRRLSLRLFLPRRSQRPPCCQQPPAPSSGRRTRGACRDAAAAPTLGRPANPRHGATILEEGKAWGGHLGIGQGTGR